MARTITIPPKALQAAHEHLSVGSIKPGSFRGRLGWLKFEYLLGTLASLEHVITEQGRELRALRKAARHG